MHSFTTISVLFKLQFNRIRWFGISFDMIGTNYYNGYFSSFLEFSRAVVCRPPFSMALGFTAGFRYKQQVTRHYSTLLGTSPTIDTVRKGNWEWGGPLIEFPIVSKENGIALFVRTSATLGIASRNDSRDLSITPSISLYGSFRLGKQ